MEVFMWLLGRKEASRQVVTKVFDEESTRDLAEVLRDNNFSEEVIKTYIGSNEYATLYPNGKVKKWKKSERLVSESRKKQRAILHDETVNGELTILPSGTVVDMPAIREWVVGQLHDGVAEDVIKSFLDAEVSAILFPPKKD